MQIGDYVNDSSLTCKVVSTCESQTTAAVSQNKKTVSG